MSNNLIQELVNLLSGGELKDSAVNILSDVIASGVTEIKQYSYFCSRFQEFLNLQKNKEYYERLEVIVKEIMEQTYEAVKNNDLNVMNNFEEGLDKKFEELQIDVDIRDSLKDNLVKYVEYYIYKTDRGFFNIICAQREIENNRDEINVLRSYMEEMESIIKEIKRELNKMHAIPVTLGSFRLDIRNVERIDNREEEIKEIERKFNSGSNVVFLHGRPGIGKTTLARLYANKFSNQNEQQCSIYFGKYDGSIKNTIAKFSSDEKKYKGKDILKYWEGLDVIERKRILIIIDNFNENTLSGIENRRYIEELTGEFFEKLTDLGIHILVTTRIRVRDDVYEVLPVTQPFELFERYAGENIQDTDRGTVEQIINAIHKNTMLITLTAHIWKKDREGRTQLLDRIVNGNLEDNNRRVSHEADANGNDETIYGQAAALLDLSGILNDKKAKKMLANITLLPLSGIQKSIFVELTKCKNENILNALIDDSWVLEEGDLIFLHPVMREIIIKHNVIKYRKCKKYCANVGNAIAMNKPFTERLKYKEVAWEIFKIFSKKRKVNITFARLIYSLSDIYDELAERKCSLEIAQFIYNHVDVFDKNLSEKARCLSGIAYSINNCYENISDLDMAEKLLYEAKEIYESIDIENVDNEIEHKRIRGRILSNWGSNCIAKGRCNQVDGEAHFEQALEWHKQALQFRLELLESYKLNVDAVSKLESDTAISYTNVGITYYYLEQYETAIDYHSKAYKIRQGSNIKAMNDNQQRIIGCVTKLFENNSDVNESYIEMILSYFPKLLQSNRYFGMYSALETNLDNFVKISGMILDDERYIRLKDTLISKKNQTIGWVKSDEELSKRFLPKLK